MACRENVYLSFSVGFKARNVPATCRKTTARSVFELPLLTSHQCNEFGMERCPSDRYEQNGEAHCLAFDPVVGLMFIRLCATSKMP